MTVANVLAAIKTFARKSKERSRQPGRRFFCRTVSMPLGVGAPIPTSLEAEKLWAAFVWWA